MSIQFRQYIAAPQYGEDYIRLRRFLLQTEAVNYPFGRWDWMVSHSMLQESGLPHIGLWFDKDAIVGASTYDTQIDGKCFFVLRCGYERLYGDMIAYAEENLAKDGNARLLIGDGNLAFQEAAAQRGYIATQDKDCDAVFTITPSATAYSLPAGFSITSMGETYDLYQYGRVLWKGFNHEKNGEGEYIHSPEKHEQFRRQFERPNVNPDLKIAVVAPDGNFAAYCGMWQDKDSKNALVEPVATDPAYRRLGLGRAVVLEAIRRCGALGAARAYVGSSQQFYYSIGFKPCMTSTFWEKKAVRT